MIDSAGRVGLSVIVCLVIAGCGGGGPSDMPDLGTVSGTVTLGGQPLADADVTFQPTGGRPSAGTTNEEGYYELSFNSDTMGAIIGNHTVRITTYREVDGDGEGDDDASNETTIIPERVPLIYNEDTELTGEVGSGSNEIDFALEEGEVLQPGEEDDGDDDDE